MSLFTLGLGFVLMLVAWASMFFSVRFFYRGVASTSAFRFVFSGIAIAVCFGIAVASIVGSAWLYGVPLI